MAEWLNAEMPKCRNADTLPTHLPTSKAKNGVKNVYFLLFLVGGSGGDEDRWKNVAENWANAEKWPKEGATAMPRVWAMCCYVIWKYLQNVEAKL